MKLFLHQKQFTGCVGLVISDEVHVTIAASACLLILNRATDVSGRPCFNLSAGFVG